MFEKNANKENKMNYTKKEKFMKDLGPFWGKVVCDEEDFIPSKPLIVINYEEELSEIRQLLESVGIPRESSMVYAKEYIKKGKIAYIINDLDDVIVCENFDGRFSYYVKTEFKERRSNMTYTEKELKKKVMEKMVRDSAHMNKHDYEILKRNYKLLGGNEDDFKNYKEEG